MAAQLRFVKSHLNKLQGLWNKVLCTEQLNSLLNTNQNAPE